MVGVLRVHSPKHRAFMGSSQFSMIRDPGAVAWLQWLTRKAPSPLKLWPSGRPALVAHFADCLSALSLPSHTWTLAGFRAGGTTHLILQGIEVARVKFLGRWRSESSMAVYVQEAMSMLVYAQLPEALRQFLALLCSRFSHQLAHPPRPAWTQVFTRRRQWRSLWASSHRQRFRP